MGRNARPTRFMERERLGPFARLAPLNPRMAPPPGPWATLSPAGGEGRGEGGIGRENLQNLDAHRGHQPVGAGGPGVLPPPPARVGGPTPPIQLRAPRA